MATLSERIHTLIHHGFSHEAAAAVLDVTVNDVVTVLEHPESEPAPHGSSVVLAAPDASLHRIVVANGGALSTSPVT